MFKYERALHTAAMMTSMLYRSESVENMIRIPRGEVRPDSTAFRRVALKIALAWVAYINFGVASGAAGGADFPNRPIRFILPVPAGGSIDPTVRLVAQPLSEKFGQQVVVDNRPGAGGIIGMEAAAKAPADGYTWLLGPIGALAINPSLYRKLPYDSLRDFSPVTLIALQPLVVVVPPQLPAKSIKELIAYARAHGSDINYGTGGSGTSPHLAIELFKTMAGIDMVHVPFKGSAPAMQELLAGRIQVMFTGLPAGLTHVRSNRLRALAVTGAKRAQAAPDIPTIGESGLPGYRVDQWFGVLLPHGAERALIQRINQAIASTVSLPEVRDRMLAQGVEPAVNTPGEFAAYIKAEITKWAKVVVLSKARVD